MLQKTVVMALIGGSLVLSGCADGKKDTSTNKKIVGVLDESNLNDIMLTVADPNEAVAYFQNAVSKDPERIDLHRGFAQSLTRAKRTEEAAIAFEKLVNFEGSTDQDRVDYAAALIRKNEWKAAKDQLNLVPPTMETFQRYRLEAMVADSEKNWKKADSFYETAVGLTTQPANVYNNWGYSKLARGQNKEAERMFLEAITFDPKLFTAKNNMVLSRASRGEYSLPVIPLTEVERAELTYTAGLAAVKQGKTDLGRGMIEEAVDLHPRHFPEAVRSLAALNKQVVR